MYCMLYFPLSTPLFYVFTLLFILYPATQEANTMAERDLGSTFLLPHVHLYRPDLVRTLHSITNIYLCLSLYHHLCHSFFQWFYFFKNIYYIIHWEMTFVFNLHLFRFLYDHAFSSSSRYKFITLYYHINERTSLYSY